MSSRPPWPGCSGFGGNGALGAGMRLLGLVDTEDPYDVDDAEILPCRSGRAGGVRADAPPDPNT